MHKRHAHKHVQSSLLFYKEAAWNTCFFHQHEIADTPNPLTSQSHHSTPTHPPPQSAANRSVYTHIDAVFCSNSGDRCDIPPSLHFRVWTCVCGRACVCDMSVLAEALCLQGHIEQRAYCNVSMLEQPSLFSPSFLPHSLPLSLLSVSLSLSLFSGALSPFSFLPIKCPTLSTFRNSTSHSDFTRLLSCLHLLFAPVCSSTPLLCSSLYPSFTFFYWFLHLRLSSIHLYLSCHHISLVCAFAISSLFTDSSSSSPLSLPSFLSPYLVSRLILCCLVHCLPYLTTFLLVMSQLTAAVSLLLYICLPCSRLSSLHPICLSFPCGLLLRGPGSAFVPGDQTPRENKYS